MADSAEHGALKAACLELLAAGYVGNGAIVCPPAFVEPLRKIAALLDPDRLAAEGFTSGGCEHEQTFRARDGVRCVACRQIVGRLDD